MQKTEGYWGNLQVKKSIDWKEWDFWVYYYIQLADTLKKILKDIFICLWNNNILMKEKVHEHDRTAAKTTVMIPFAKLNNNILQKYRW